MRLWLLPVFLLTACAAPGDYRSYLNSKHVSLPEAGNFSHCRGYGCRHIDHLSLSEQDWAKLAPFFKDVESAATERMALGPAIGKLEEIAGGYNGTQEERGGTYVKIGDDQHDCIDESVNTTVYLHLLQEKGWLKFHDIGKPQGRLPLLGRGLGPHQTAVVIDRQDRKKYAVDSWFHDNGHPAEVVDFDEWFYGWRPD